MGRGFEADYSGGAGEAWRDLMRILTGNHVGGCRRLNIEALKENLRLSLLFIGSTKWNEPSDVQ